MNDVRPVPWPRSVAVPSRRLIGEPSRDDLLTLLDPLERDILYDLHQRRPNQLTSGDDALKLAVDRAFDRARQTLPRLRGFVRGLGLDLFHLLGVVLLELRELIEDFLAFLRPPDCRGRVPERGSPSPWRSPARSANSVAATFLPF